MKHTMSVIMYSTLHFIHTLTEFQVNIDMNVQYVLSGTLTNRIN